MLNEAVKQGLLTEPIRIIVMNPPAPPLITIRR